MYDDMQLNNFEPLVPVASPIADWNRVPPRTRRPVVLPPTFGQPKKKPARRSEMRYYQMVTRGLV